MKAILTALLICSSAVLPGSAAETPDASKSARPSLYDTARFLTGKIFVDLTHSFRPGIPHWKGYPDEKVKTLYSHTRHGFRAEQYTLVGQWGTHVDPPGHFHKDLRTLDQIPPQEMIAPLVVVDVVLRSLKDPDYTLSVDDLKAWESKYGKIPPRAFVVMRTDWAKRWPNLERMQNKGPDGVMHYPGWSVEALKFLVQERNVVGIGHETTDTDAGFNVSADRYPAQTYIHGEDRWQVELLTGLNEVPEYGALAVVSFPKPEKGYGFPARVFAVLP
jgi:kynurenine formamidase